MKYYINCFKHYADFKGRASRREMWIFMLINIVIGAALIYLNNHFINWNIHFNNDFEILLKSLFSGMSVPYIAHYYEMYPEAAGFGILPLLFNLAIIVPTFAVEVRRLHDINLGLLHFLATFVPVIGWIWWIIFGCIPGTDGENKYGPAPVNE